MSVIINFYNNCGKPYFFSDIVYHWHNDQWEIHHDFIQYLFPTRKESQAVPDSPVLSLKDIQEFQTSQELKHKLREAFIRFQLFLGAFDTNMVGHKSKTWSKPNRNWLRITRCLESLSTLGLLNEAEPFLKQLNRLAREYKIPHNTVNFWQQAIQ